MKNKQAITYKWAYLPFVFSSAAILATAASAAPGASQHYQDARQVSTANYEYVGGKTQIGFGVTDDGDVSVDLNQVISETENSSTSAGLWAGYELKGEDKGIRGSGVQINHSWVSRDGSGRAVRVNKVFGAYDRNQDGHAKATVGYGQEYESLFWEGHASKGLSDKKGGRDIKGKRVSDKAYDYGVGGSIGTFLKGSNMRVRAGLDHEWGDDVGEGESTAKNTTLSAGVEKFFRGTPHSLGLDVAASKPSGGYGGSDSDTNVTGKLSYRYDFGGASIYQPDRRYRRVRVEVPGTAVAPRYAKRTQYKRVPIYKTVPVYGKKTIRKPYKQLVKSTMELEGQTFFKLNSSRLIPSAKNRLLQIAGQIRKSGYKGSIRITGNTCGLGDAAYDQRLSEQRAYAVRNFLVENGFNPDHLIARGLGKGHPKYPNTPDQGFKNRRVDIEYVTERQVAKTGYRTEQQRVRTGTRRVATGFKNVPVGSTNVMIDNGRAGTPRVIWRTEVIPSSPAWIKRALHNNIKHNTIVNTYRTSAGSTTVVDTEVNASDDVVTVCSVSKALTIDVLHNDDQDAIITGIATQPQHGTAVVSNGKIVYTPNSGFSGTENFTYAVKDLHGNTATARVSITICSSPNTVIVADDVATSNNGQPVIIDVLSNDDQDARLNRIVTQPAHGTARIVNGQVVYTPAAGFSGTDSFTYEVIDPQGHRSTATVSVTVNGVASNVNATDDSASTSQGNAVTIDVLSNDSYPDGDALTVIGFTQGVNGQVSRAANGQLTYTPNTGFTGTDSFSYTITDGHGGSDTATVTVNVSGGAGAGGVQSADDTATTTAGNTVTIDVLSNDDSDASISRIVSQPGSGTAQIVNGKIDYTPMAGFTGTDTFTYEVTDPQGNKSVSTVTVTVNPAAGSNFGAMDDVATVSGSNTSVTIDVLANDDNAVRITAITGAPDNGTATIVNGKIVYTPNAGFTGTDYLNYEAVDANGNADIATVVITVSGGGSTAPVAATDNVSTTCSAVTINVLDNDSGTGLSIFSVGNASLGDAVISGNSIVYTPSASCSTGNTGQDSFTYTITDGQGNKATGTVNVDVNGTSSCNSTCIKAEPDDTVTAEGQVVTINVLGNDAGKGLKITSVDSPANGTTEIVGNSIKYTPDNGFTGDETFWYDIVDKDGNTDSAMVAVYVGSGD